MVTEDQPYDPLIEESVEIAADPAQVWAVVHDVRRMPEWSPQVESVRLRQGFDEVAEGTEFTNRNVLDDLAWTTHGTIERFEPERAFAFRIAETRVVWSFTLEPTTGPGEGGGTRLVQRRETPDGISDVSLELAESTFGGQEAFTTRLRAGMQETLAAIRSAVEDGSGAPR